ncbi:MAG: dihydroxyacetone kinase subunit DhaK [Bacillota bacterium]
MKMKKFINQPENLEQELLEGLVLANQDLIELTSSRIIVNKALKDADRVTIVSLTGSGHEPGFSGFVGEGMLDVSVPGDIFAAPGPEPSFEALKIADKGKGVLFVVGNHPGDMLTGNMTMEMARNEGMHVVKIVSQEDVSNAPREKANERRGLVGSVILFKIAGAAAAQGKSLEEIAKLSQDFVDNMATIAVAMRGCTHPTTGEELASIDDDKMAIGMGQHGEKGVYSSAILSADETTVKLVDILLDDLNIKPGEKLMLVVNGLGAATLMEQLIVFRKAYKYLEEKGMKVVASWVNEILTVQETAGFQIFIARMSEETLAYWNAPCKTPYLVRA